MQVFTTPEFICIVMEIARGGDLLRYTLKHYPVAAQEEQARWIFQQLIIGLDYCHRRVICSSTHLICDLGRVRHWDTLVRQWVGVELFCV